MVDYKRFNDLRNDARRQAYEARKTIYGRRHTDGRNSEIEDGIHLAAIGLIVLAVVVGVVVVVMM